MSERNRIGVWRTPGYLGCLSPKEFEKLWLLKKSRLTKVPIFI